VSFAASVAVFWAVKEVEKARGAKVARLATRMDVRVRNDIVNYCVEFGSCVDFVK
jgi:hypothetical protein